MEKGRERAMMTIIEGSIVGDGKRKEEE